MKKIKKENIFPKKKFVILFVFIAFAVMQNQNAASPYQTNTVQGFTTAINYQNLDRVIEIDFEGTTLLPGGKGMAVIEDKAGNVQISAKFINLSPASQFGTEYLTYVLWAISLDGKATNLGELLITGKGESQLKTNTSLQTFSLLVTAEPYFAVTRPGNVIILENVIKPYYKDKVELVEVQYELLPRGQYIKDIIPKDRNPVVMDGNTPFEVYQARNAVQIAKAAGAEIYAADSFSNVEWFLALTEMKSEGKKNQASMARVTVQAAEDSRSLALKRQTAEALAKEPESKNQVDVALRAQLFQQLNSIFPTRDTSRGLMFTLYDILFQSKSSELQPVALDKLTKVAQIVTSYPGLRLEIEGHADGLDNDVSNHLLSEHIAQSVQNYLVSQGVSASAVVSKGFGGVSFIDLNDPTQIRKLNRRVELFVNGEIIGGVIALVQ